MQKLYLSQSETCQTYHNQVTSQICEKNSIGDARTPQPREIIFNTMRSSEKVQRSGDFQSNVSYIKVQIMFRENNV